MSITQEMKFYFTDKQPLFMWERRDRSAASGHRWVSHPCQLANAMSLLVKFLLRFPLYSFLSFTIAHVSEVTKSRYAYSCPLVHVGPNRPSNGYRGLIYVKGPSVVRPRDIPTPCIYLTDFADSGVYKA